MRGALLLAALLAQAGSPPPGRAAMVAGVFEVSGVPLPVEIGTLSVPANRTSGSPAKLTLSFVRFKSSSASPGSPIVFLAGGPGDAATRAVRGMPMAFLDDLRAIADVIAFDQRGTGSSEPLRAVCPPGTLLPRDRPADPVFVLDTLRRRLDACLTDVARAGIDVMGLTTVESADDLEDLRRAIDARQLTLLAGSYGTHLALATARRHPAAIDRMALAGVEGPDDTLKLPSLVDGVLAAIARARRPTLPDDVRALAARLGSEPGRFVFPGGQVILLGPWDLQRWVAESLDTVPEIDALVAAIPSMLDGDLSVLGRWALGSRLPKPINLMNLAMDCASYASPGRLARIRREAPAAVLGDVINFPLASLCDTPGLPRLPDTYREPIVSDVPALLISGTLDGRTPVHNAEEAARGLSRARTLVVEGASHGLFREAGVLTSILAFLRQ